MSMLSTAIAAALATVQTVAGIPVTYTRAGNSPLSISAVPGSTLSQTAADNESMLWRRTRDYLITASLLNFGSGPVEPAASDTITEVDPVTNITYVFTVLPIGTEPCWRWSDPQRNIFRIHTKLTALTNP